MLELPHRFLSSTTLVVFGAGPSQRSALARPPSAAPLYIHPTLLLASIPPNNQELGVRRSIWGPTLGVGSHSTSHAAFVHNRVCAVRPAYGVVRFHSTPAPTVRPTPRSRIIACVLLGGAYALRQGPRCPVRAKSISLDHSLRS